MNPSPLRPWRGQLPQIGQRVYLDPSSVVIGRVTIGDESSIWPLVAIRGDVNTIHIGSATNIQDGSILHVTHEHPKGPEGGWPLRIGDEVTVGHHCILHGCTIGDRSLIGMGSTVLDGAVVEPGVLLGAGSLVPPGKVLTTGYLWLGSPVRRVRELSSEERAWLGYSAGHYQRLKDEYLAAGTAS
jgi:carbonic anhydrase/acetyltransferase-like protein (isoleucine patch superfamily)